MRILRWLAIAFGALVLSLVAVGVAARFADGPLGPFPGGPLRAGEWAREGAVDWTFATDLGEIEFQLVEPPRSRITWLVVHEGELYIPCGAPTTLLKQWPQQALADGRGLLRVEGRLYERQAVKVTDRGLFEKLAVLLGEKYGVAGDGTLPEDDDVWFFRMDLRGPETGT